MRRSFHYQSDSGGPGTPGYVGYFLEAEPVAMAGYTIYIYHLTAAEADRIRAKLGVPPLDRGEVR
jgi:hypothetical protein